MVRKTIPTLILAGVSAAALNGTAFAEAPADFHITLAAAARETNPGFSGFSASRGEQFFKATHGSEWSCASCHTQDPLRAGKHAKTGKEIAALAPAANPARFTRPDKVDKWFKRNCNDVLGRACTSQEKGDVLAYLMSLN